MAMRTQWEALVLTARMRWIFGASAMKQGRMEEKISDGRNGPAKGSGKSPHKTQKRAFRKEFTKLS